MENHCLICGVDISGRGNVAKYCPDHALMLRKDKMKGYKSKYYAELRGKRTGGGQIKVVYRDAAQPDRVNRNWLMKHRNDLIPGDKIIIDGKVTVVQ